MKYLIILLIITSQNIFCQSKYIRFYPEYENTFHISDNGKGVIKTFVKKRNSEKYDYNNINHNLILPPCQPTGTAVPSIDFNINCVVL